MIFCIRDIILQGSTTKKKHYSSGLPATGEGMSSVITSASHHLCEVNGGGCQIMVPFLGTLNIRCRFIIGIQKGTMILTTTHRGSV